MISNVRKGWEGQSLPVKCRPVMTLETVSPKCLLLWKSCEESETCLSGATLAVEERTLHSSQHPARGDSRIFKVHPCPCKHLPHLTSRLQRKPSTGCIYDAHSEQHKCRTGLISPGAFVGSCGGPRNHRLFRTRFCAHAVLSARRLTRKTCYRLRRQMPRLGPCSSPPRGVTAQFL